MSPVERSNSGGLSTGHRGRGVIKGMDKAFFESSNEYTTDIYTNGLSRNFMGQMPATSYTLTSANTL